MDSKNFTFVGEGRKSNCSLEKGSAILSLLFLLILIFSSEAVAQYSHRNVTVLVNVTNAGPEVIAFNLTNPLTLNAGNFTTVYCNVTLRDYNGFNDLDSANASFYYFENESGPNDNNTHYTNNNCTRISDDGEFLANYSCEFNVSYAAFNGTWYCNVTVNDTRAYVGNSRAGLNISPLYALNVTDIIDYGNLSVTDYSENKTATITNFGNMAINVSVLGYGATQGDGLGFVCTQGTNISVQYQRFSSDIAAGWAAKTPLASTNRDLNITLPRQTDDSAQVFADTYWQLYVPPNPFGLCTGTVRFTATAP